MYSGIGAGNLLQLLGDIFELGADGLLSGSVDVDVEQVQAATEPLVDHRF